MNVEIISLKPFKVSMTLYNLLGEIDGHPKAIFDMATGTYDLFHYKTYGNMISMLPSPMEGEPIVLSPDSPISSIVKKQIWKRIKRTGFCNEPEKTKLFNPHYEGNLKYPSYYFIMWDRNQEGDFKCHFINEEDYRQLSLNIA